ncbi:MAG: hypothetical protein NC489_27890 [Ruminococcus flavefaciens]|nr:hypothetical protein [Ruminococcus flavefaciens]
MRAVRIKVDPFSFVNFLKVECTKELNQHGMIKITGVIEQEDENVYLNMASQETWVNVYAISENEEMTNFFTGILTGLWIKKEGQVCVLTIEIKTGSFLLDIKPHTRSFQDSGFQYSQVINTCLKAERGSCYIPDINDKATGCFLLQYQESDWNFIKRLASYAGTVLIPTDNVAEKKLCFGYREMSAVEEMETVSCRVEQNYEQYEKRKAAGFEDLKLSDLVSYTVDSREIYRLGETVQFENARFIIAKINSWLEGQELYHEYHLITKESSRLLPVYNNDLVGVSLIANVTAVEKTQVKVQIEDDENKTECGSRWFDYATVYSTPDGAGWYCMPEVGDKVRLVIPDHVEGHAYVASSIHLGMAGGRNNPDEKSWKNPQNKEILFTPDAIILRNNSGISLELSDSEGVKVRSNKDIIVQADRNIQIRSQQAGVNMAAETAILMQQGVAKVEISNDINISGGKIYMN